MPPPKLVTPVVDDAGFWVRLGEEIKPKIRPLFRDLFIEGAIAGGDADPVVATKDVALDLDAINDIADDLIANYTDEWWAQIEQTTRERLRAAIAEARELGLGAEFVAREIAPLFGETRAVLIAVSEVTNLFGQGAQATYRAAGFPTWIWRTANDPAVDPICADLATESEASPFPMSRVFVRAHPRCRCWPVPAGRAVTMPSAVA
ncbi:hypothetical protein LCGC14_0443840 [marine sediment metagenome]|uniref:Phage head morphogenesis domain-containing protein n=1 Tax=marine sediment metagenome TaxID=412755 RepID=A0A0F9VTW6_9ZZZZ